MALVCDLVPKVIVNGVETDSILFTTLTDNLKLSRIEALEVYKMVHSKSFADKVGDWKSGLGYKGLTTTNEPKMYNLEGTDEPYFEGEVGRLNIKDILDDKKVKSRLDRVLKLIRNTVETLKKRESNYIRLKYKDVGFSPKQQAIDNLGNIIESTNSLLDKNELLEAFVGLLSHTHDNLSLIYDYMNKKDLDVTSPDFIQNVLQFKEYIKEAGLFVIPDLAYDKPVLYKAIQDIITMTNELNELIPDTILNYVAGLVKEHNPNNPLVKDHDELIKILKESLDISNADLYLENVESTHDELLNLLGRMYKNKMEEVAENTRDTVEMIKEESKLLRDAGVKDFKFMIAKGAKYLTKVGEKYKAAYKILSDKIIDKDGNKRKYLLISQKDIADGKYNQADLKYNLDLLKDKQAINEFRKTEEIDENGLLVDGENHRYTKEFKEIRDQFENYDDSIRQWVKKQEVSIDSYNGYKRKYFNDEILITSPVKTNLGEGVWEHLGLTEEKKVRFVKSEYVEVTEKHWEDDYIKLIDPKSPQDFAKLRFYNFYTDKIENDYFKRIPKDIADSMMGRLFTVRSNFAESLTKNGGGFFKAVSKQLKNSFAPANWLNTKSSDGINLDTRDIPLLFVGSLRDNELITKLEATLKALNPLDKNFKKDKKELTLKIDKEKTKLNEDEVSEDLEQSLIAVTAVVENYATLKAAEDSFKAVAEVIKNRKYKKNEKSEVLIDGELSNSAKRADSWFRLMFYEDSDIDSSQIGTVVKKFMSYNSLQAIGGNIPSAVNNYLMGKINQRIESFAGTFYSMKNYNSAQFDYSKAMTAILINTAKNIKNKTNKASTKYEAVVREFNFIQSQASVDGREHSFLDFLYVGQEAGEYANQSKVGVAMIKDFMVTDKDGNTISLYDAYVWDEKTKTLKLMDGVVFSKNEKYSLTNKIKNVNTHISGNYNTKDKVLIQEHALGQAALQFHKWVYRFFKNRFSPNYYDQGLETEMEGRYLSFFTFIKEIKTFGLNFKMNYNQMTELEQANMRRTLAEGTYFMMALIMFNIFKALSDGVDEEDENLKRMVNFMSSRSSQIMGELSLGVNPKGMYDLVKTPFAVLRTFGEAAEVLTKGVALPYNLATGHGKDNYYKKGVYKGDLKFAKEVFDIVPLLKIINQYRQYGQQENFFIK